MHPFSVATLAIIFGAGYNTAKWELYTRLYELAIFAVEHGVLTRTAKGFALLSIVFSLFILPAHYLASLEAIAVRTALSVRLIDNFSHVCHSILGQSQQASPPVNSYAVEGPYRQALNNDMVEAHGLLRIFWPSDLTNIKEQGVLVGWKNAKLDIFVVTCLQNAETRRVQGALHVGSLYKGSRYPLKRIFEMCGTTSMRVLGALNPANPSRSFDPDHLIITTGLKRSMPCVFCPPTYGISVQFNVYDRPSPHRMQYLSLAPITLALADKPLISLSTTQTPREDSIGNENPASNQAALVDKLKYHTVVYHAPTQWETLLPIIVAQINCSSELADLISSNAFILETRQKRSLSVGEKVVESAMTLRDHILALLRELLLLWVWPVLVYFFVLALASHRYIAELVLKILEWRRSPDSGALKDISATAQQIDIRLQQFCYWPLQYLTLRRRRQDWESITDKHPDYIRFYNSLWLVANDVIIGIAVGSYIIDNANWVASEINSALNDWTIAGLINMINWLTDWPAGLKLNNELAEFLGRLVLFMITYWESWVMSLQPLLPALIYFIGFASFAGATMTIAMFSDLLSLLTVHIYCFYTASARIFNWQLTIIMSLFHLFRGKKHNVLRNRIDSCDYDLDQLLLGTILFTLLFFLLPTVAVFYLTSTTARMAIIFLRATQDTLLACLNHFPLFAVMLRVKDPRRLPGGICFELISTPGAGSPDCKIPSETSPTSHILLKSIPLPLRAMFDQYFQLGHRIRKHYLSPKVVWCLVTGRFIPPIHRKSMYSLQYSMLPAERVGVTEIWHRLTEGIRTKSFTKGSKYNKGFGKPSNGWTNGNASTRNR